MPTAREPRTTADTVPADSAAPADRTGHDGASLPEQIADRVSVVVTVPLEVTKRILPDHPLPLTLGAGALAVAGVVEWPVAVGAALGYAALKRWTPWGQSPSAAPEKPDADSTGDAGRPADSADVRRTGSGPSTDQGQAASVRARRGSTRPGLEDPSDTEAGKAGPPRAQGRAAVAEGARPRRARTGTTQRR